MTPAARKIRLILMLRQAGVTDPKVLSAMERLPREMFVPEIFQDQAYENTALPIGHGQTISPPVTVGFMTQALKVEARSRVLEIGTGSGYQTAVLAALCRRVYTVEQCRPLLQEAAERLRALGIENVATRHGDGREGWPEIAPVDRILVGAALPEIPPVLASQLADGGILVLPVGQRPEDQHLVRVTREGSGLRTEPLGRVRFVPILRDEGENETPDVGPEPSQ